MKILCVIAARGGSKRIPRKNIREFCGKPILAYSIEAALSLGPDTTVMASTEDEEIAAIARAYGAEVPFLRSREKADDYTPVGEVWLEVAREYLKRGKQFDAIVPIYPTAPFISGERIREGLEILENTGCKTVMPLAKFSYPILRAYVIREGKVDYKWPELKNVRSQDMESFYYDAAQFYCARADEFLKTGSIMGGDVRPLFIAPQEIQDIDTEDDWIAAEEKYRKWKGIK